MREYKIRTKNGFFDFADMENSDILIDDIANSLSRNNRFTGHTIRPYTVAQHSVYVAYLMQMDGLSFRLQLLGLVHDFHEAYFSDMSSPLKWFLKDVWGFDANAVCDKIDVAIFNKLGIDLPTEEEHKIIKEYDMRAYEHERLYVFDLNETFKKEGNGKFSDDHKNLERFSSEEIYAEDTQQFYASLLIIFFTALKDVVEYQKEKKVA